MEKRETMSVFLSRLFDELNSLVKIQDSTKNNEEFIDSVKTGIVKTNLIHGEEITTLDSNWIKLNKKRLLALEEFRFTKEINELIMPTYAYASGDVNMVPLKEGYSKTDVNSCICNSYVIKEDMDTHYFPEVVNIYSISRSARIYDLEDMENVLKQKNKIHILPPMLNHPNWEMTREFRFRFNPDEILEENITAEEWKKSILKEIESKVFDNYEPSFSSSYNFLIRGTRIVRDSIEIR
jgi:hypothetical protein